MTGKLSSGTNSLLSVVQEQIEPSIIAHDQNHGPRPTGWKRPFIETLSANRKPIAKTLKKTVEFPEKDESMGELAISYMGAAPGNFLEQKVHHWLVSYYADDIQIIPMQAIEILGTYMTSSAVAPLNKEYVEIESPLWFV